jgi:hypothetical protein
MTGVFLLPGLLMKCVQTKILRGQYETGGARWIAIVVATLLAAVVLPYPGGADLARAGVGPGSKIYVFPYQPVFRGVGKEITSQTTDLLKNEIKHSDEVQLQKGPIFIPEATATEVTPLSDSDLKAAEKLRKSGENSYGKFQFDKAIKAFTGSLAKYEKSLALMKDFTPVLDTLLMLSVCYYRTDHEKDGAMMLVKVIRLKPDLVLDPEKYPPMFRNTAEAIRKKLLLKRRGEVEVVANEEGASVFFDGNKVGVTPILMKELVPGEHFLRVEKEGLQPWAGKVTVVSTQRRRVLAAMGGVKKLSGPLGEIASDLRSNRITAQTRKNVREQGRKIGADFVILGGVGKVGENYRVGTFLLKVSKDELCPLPEIQFDPDLLGASVEVYNMASVLYKRVEGCPDAVKAPVVALVQTAAKKTSLKSVAVGPVALPPEKRTGPARVVQPSGRGPAVPSGRGPAVPSGRGPAVPANPRTGGQTRVEPVRNPSVTSEGLATIGGSAMSAPVRARPAVIPVPIANSVTPVDEQIGKGPKWYKSWWFWTIVSVAVVGGTAGGLYAAGVFDGGASGASVTVRWPTP